MKKIPIKLKKVNFEEIIPSEWNPRDITQEAFSGLKASLEKFGCVSLIVVNQRNMQIVGGHQRYKALKELGVKGEIPVVIVDLDEKGQKAMNVALNNESIEGTWTDGLAKILKEIEDSGFGSFIGLKLEELKKDNEAGEAVIEESLREKELDEAIPTAHKCPGCGYEW
ncbi:MAG TPA: ParB N-terminal domain-containing protein [Candidatus Omnitrophota bacterium]|nr:ParB N-terminal domain-containing protein [Candidatus Omnitrophota bacterium]